MKAIAFFFVIIQVLSGMLVIQVALPGICIGLVGVRGDRRLVKQGAVAELWLCFPLCRPASAAGRRA